MWGFFSPEWMDVHFQICASRSLICSFLYTLYSTKEKKKKKKSKCDLKLVEIQTGHLCKAAVPWQGPPSVSAMWEQFPASEASQGNSAFPELNKYCMRYSLLGFRGVSKTAGNHILPCTRLSRALPAPCRGLLCDSWGQGAVLALCSHTGSRD